MSTERKPIDIDILLEYMKMLDIFNSNPKQVCYLQLSDIENIKKTTEDKYSMKGLSYVGSQFPDGRLILSTNGYEFTFIPIKTT